MRIGRALGAARPWLRPGAAVAVVALLGLIAVGRVRVLKRDALEGWQARISALADGKKLALEGWLGERRDAAAIVAEYGGAVLESGRGSAGRGGQVGGDRPWSAVQELAGFSGLWLLDAAGRVAGVADARAIPPGVMLGAAAATARDGRFRVEGPQRGGGGNPLVGFAAPMLAPAGAGRPGLPGVTGAVLLTIDPADFLYPQVAHQPVSSATGQCYLVTRDRDDVILLSPRHFPAEPALASRTPWTSAPLIDRLAADGIRTFGTYADTLTGLDVVAAGRRIAGTGWGLVCRMDGWEAFASYRLAARNEAVLALLVLLAGLSAWLFLGRKKDREKEQVRQNAEEALLAAEHRFRALVEQSLAGIYIIRNNRFHYVNPTLARIFGYTVDEVLALPSVVDLVHEPDRGMVQERIRQRLSGETETASYTFAGLRKDGTHLDIEVHGTRTVIDGQPCILGTLLDVTERRVLEQQLRQAQKMEAVGQLAGGIAHDFNNLLTAILGLTELVRQDLPPGSSAANDLDAVARAGKRGAELTRKLLAFSRRQRLEFQRLELASVVADFAPMLRRVVREDVTLEIIPAPQASGVRGDAGALEQIVMNLVTNARDAMPHGGRVEIRVGREQLGEEQCQTFGWGTPGNYVTLVVEDTGVGMDEATLSHVFEPFFTTKPVGSGTGLGLAMVYGLAKQHRGYVHVMSRPGQGTVVTVYLPAVDGPVTEAPVREVVRAVGGRECVLLVEDEESLRDIGRRVLERHGYRVLTAADGLEALEILLSGAAIDLVVADLIMPRMGGAQVIREMRRRGRAIRVLYTSGYPDRDLSGAGLVEPDAPFLSKPWTMDGLLSKVREALDVNPA